MSRIYVKNLPKTCTEQDLRKHFNSLNSEITDIKIARTKDGKSRQFAFIGFRTLDQGTKAVTVYNKSFMGPIRINVELAREIGDDSVLQRAWSKHTKDKLQSKQQEEELLGNDNTVVNDTEISTNTKEKKLPIAIEAAKSVKHKEQLEEYLALSRSRSTVPTWVNDDTMNRQPIDKPGIKRNDPSKNDTNENNNDIDETENNDDNASTDSEEYQEIPSTTKKPKVTSNSDDEEDDEDDDKSNKPITINSDLDYLKSKIKKNFDSDDNDDVNDNEDEDMNDDDKEMIDEDEEIDNDTDEEVEETNQKVSSKSKNTKDTKHKPTTEDTTDTNIPESIPTDEPIDLAETGRLFVRNLPYTYSDAPDIILKEYFSKWGPIADIHVPVDFNGKVKGFAYITYIVPEHAVSALANTDGKIFQGRILHVLPAKPLVNTNTNSDSISKIGSHNGGGANESSYKRKKEEEKRAGAGNENEVSNIWNTLFVHTDTVISATAERLGVSRGDVLDRDAKNMAVRVALAETQIIQDTKSFLEQEGVSLPTLEQALVISNESSSKTKPTGNSTSGVGSLRLPRSDTIILVKNLPPTTDSESLRELFGRYGVLIRCVLPPSKAIALIEFSDNKSAKKAFTSLAYARFQRVPLYLEWAPDGIFTTKALVPSTKETNNQENTNTDASKKRKRDETETNSDKPTDKQTSNNTEETALPTDGRTLFVKNLSFSTTEEGLRNMFTRCGTVRSVRIPKRRNPKYKPDWTSTTTSISSTPATPMLEWLSMGYGFVEYTTKEDAEKAMRQLQGKMLDDHSLQLKLSTNKGTTTTSTNTTSSAASNTKRAASTGDTSTATKLMVRNLAFEATKGDIQELFSSCGNIKTIRIPKKMDGHHRGFAFIEFLTHAEAASAMSTLASTHLYGRHLVIEWASQDTEHNGVGITSV